MFPTSAIYPAEVSARLSHTDALAVDQKCNERQAKVNSEYVKHAQEERDNYHRDAYENARNHASGPPAARG